MYYILGLMIYALFVTVGDEHSWQPAICHSRGAVQQFASTTVENSRWGDLPPGVWHLQVILSIINYQSLTTCQQFRVLYATVIKKKNYDEDIIINL